MKKTIALIFDFDDTFAPDSTSDFLAMRGVEVDAFWAEEVGGLIQQGWDPVPAYFYKMVEFSRTRKTTAPITQECFQSFGRTVTCFNGAEHIFTLLRQYAASLHPDIVLEFYMISSGIGDIVRHVSIARHFMDIWAGDFHYNDDGSIMFPKNIVSFTDKTRYLFQISKGFVGIAARENPFDVNRKVGFSDIRIPFNQMIFVGDGYTDVPCFALLKKYGGIPLAVYDPEKTGGLKKAMRFKEDKRVHDVLPVDYAEGGLLASALQQSVKSIIMRMGQCDV